MARESKDKPCMIIAKTMKGKYFLDEIENQLNWHGKPVTKSSQTIVKHLESLMKNQSITLTPSAPEIKFAWEEPVSSSKYHLKPHYTKDKETSTRVAYGEALKKLGEQDKHDHIVVLDADVKNSTMSETFEKAFPQRFINCFIAEQNMVGMALGVSKRNRIPFISTFGAFYTRAFDHIRMSAISFVKSF